MTIKKNRIKRKKTLAQKYKLGGRMFTGRKMPEWEGIAMQASLAAFDFATAPISYSTLLAKLGKYGAKAVKAGVEYAIQRS